nr:hypothetical protein [Tanacetum cinerariifolium]
MRKKKYDTDVQNEKKKDDVKKKDVVLRMKRSLTVADNILPNPDEAVKASREEYILKQIPKGPSNVKVISSDDERTESDKEKVNEEIANEEMADEEKANDEKTKEEKSNDEQARADQENNDQAGVIIIETQNERPELPPSLFWQILSELETNVEALSKVDHTKAIEESVKANGKLDPTRVLKKRSHDDKDQDPPVDSEKEKKRRRRKDTESSNKQTTSTESSKDLEGLAFKLLKSTCKNNIKLEYNMEHCYLALSDQLDWVNLEGDGCLPWSSTKESYDQNSALGIHYWGLKRKLFYRSKNAVTSRHEVYSRMKILSVIRISLAKQFGYDYLKEIVIRRAD